MQEKENKQEGETGETLNFFQYKPGVKLMVLVFVFIILIVGLFYLGGIYTCKNADGIMIGKLYKMECKVLNVTDVCEKDGQYFQQIPFEETLNDVKEYDGFN